MIQYYSPLEDTSLQCFRRFIITLPDGRVDARGVFSRECYCRWLSTRKTAPSKPEEAFRRVLTAHVRGSAARKPFRPEEEQALLVELRKKRVWPCFKNMSALRVGIQGFKASGYHEQQRCRLTSYSKSNQKSQSKVQVERSRCLSSFEVFLKFAGPDQSGTSRILSKECFQAWVRTRRNGVKYPAQSFRKALIAHLCGRDGRRPFPESLEGLIIAELTKERVWPCFAGTTDKAVKRIGQKGFRDLAYHQAQSLSKFCAPNSIASKPRPTPNVKIEQVGREDDEIIIENLNQSSKKLRSQRSLKRCSSIEETMKSETKLDFPLHESETKRARVAKNLFEFVVNSGMTTKEKDLFVDYDPYDDLLAALNPLIKSPPSESSVSSSLEDDRSSSGLESVQDFQSMNRDMRISEYNELFLPELGNDMGLAYKEAVVTPSKEFYSINAADYSFSQFPPVKPESLELG